MSQAGIYFLVWKENILLGEVKNNSVHVNVSIMYVCNQILLNELSIWCYLYLTNLIFLFTSLSR